MLICRIKDKKQKIIKICLNNLIKLLVSWRESEREKNKELNKYPIVSERIHIVNVSGTDMATSFKNPWFIAWYTWA